MKLIGRIIFQGNAEGDVLYTDTPLLIYGGIMVDTGEIIENGHPLEGKNVKDKILVFPEAKGSTVGSYTILQLKKNGMAPQAIINELCEPIIATGVIMAKIPCVDKVDIQQLRKCSRLKVQDNEIYILKN